MPPGDNPSSPSLLCAKDVAARLGVKKWKMVYELWDLGPENGGMASLRIGKKERARRCSPEDVEEYLQRQKKAELLRVRGRRSTEQ